MEQSADKITAGIPQEARAVFSAEFLDSAKVLQWFLSRYYPDGYKCPDCGAPVSEKAIISFLSLKRFTCSGCGSQPRATKGTVLQDSPFTPNQLYLLALLIHFGVSDREIAAILAVAPLTVTNWRAKLEALAEVGH